MTSHKGIDKLLIKNFKAYNDEKEISFEGKNVLLFGENGSGKSSIYWALYTLLKGINRGSKSEKYFKYGHPENLLNIHASQVTPSYIKLSLVNEPALIHRIDSRGNSIEDGSPMSNTIENLSRSSDFIAHRLLLNFYNFNNSKTIDLWTVFERDIIPFLNCNKNKGNQSLSAKYSEIVNKKPYVIYEGKTIRNSKNPEDYLLKIKSFNEDLLFWIGEINILVNDFYTTHFSSKDTSQEYKDISIKLEYDEDDYLKYDFVQQIREVGAIRDIVKTSIKELVPPRIHLKIKHCDTPIPRPQSFLNEAMLTAIAISIRFSLLSDMIRPQYPNRILVLDDLLVSLDMNNRQKVLDIVLDEYSSKYQVLFFTHDRSLYNFIHNQLRRRSLLKTEWKVLELYKSVNDSQTNPDIYEISENHAIEKAEYHLAKHDYPACGIYLRRECEAILDRILPSSLLNIPKDSGTESKNLNDKLLAFKEFCTVEKIDFREYEDLILYKDVVLNTLAHNDLESPLYRYELDKTMKILKKLNEINSPQVIYKKNDALHFKLTKIDGTKFTIRMQLREALKVLAVGIDKRLSNYSKVRVTETIDDGNSQKLDFELENIEAVLEKYCSELCIQKPSLLDVMFDREGKKVLF